MKKKVFTTNTTLKIKPVTAVSGVLLLAALLCEGLLISALQKLQMLPDKYFLLILAALGLMTLALALMVLKAGEKRLRRILGWVLCLILAAGCLVGTHIFSKLNQTVTAISQPDTVSTVFGVYVRSEDSAQNIEDTAAHRYAMTDSVDPDQTRKAAEQIQILAGCADIENLESVNALVDALYDGSTDAIILNQSYADMVAEVEAYGDFFTRMRLLTEIEITEKEEPQQEPAETAPEAETEPEIEFDPTTIPFIVYLSGSDTRSSALVKGRSDVNILAAVNPVTKQILLVNTPRDYWVRNPAGDNERDKLTHCGLYGIENSMAALEDLYGQPITQYAQINFTGFERLINTIGGITIYSSFAFDAGDTFRVEVGNNYMNGAQALAFARERHNVAGGDITRGAHQMKVIAAVVAKLSAATIIKNYSAILDTLQGMFVTSLTPEEISDVIKMQLDDMATWEVLSYSVTGDGGHDTNFSMPGQISYVMYPNDEMIAHASDLMSRILAGEVLTKEDIG